MGTSSRQPAPTGGEWTTAKTRLTNWARGGGTNSDLATAALSAFVGALGGATAAASQATGGVRATAGLGDFLADVGRDGLDETLDRYGLADLVGGEPVEVLGEVAGRIVGAGETTEEAVARDALISVLNEIFEEPDSYDDLEAIVVDADRLREFVALYLIEYIFERVLHELGDRIRDNVSPTDAPAYERRLHEDVAALVRLDLSTIADPLTFGWQTDAGRARCRELLAEALRMLTLEE
jgi:hypothetical protein